jgi:asparagine synthase (glutamine-hydrolysing)
MCGIAGWVTTGTGADEAVLRRMVTALAHRGPDDEGYAVGAPAGMSCQVALGSCRLAIIDPEGGRQPIRDESAALTLVYNGELYNFRELRAELEQRGRRCEGRSDTEVILRAYQEWGDACVERFRGMFAFALWDGTRGALVLARDPFGEKPLFLHGGDDRLVFGSEIKGLLAFPGVPMSPDYQAMSEYLVYRYVPGPATLFTGIRKLPPGTVGVWRDGKLRLRRYYQPPDGRRRTPPARQIDPVAGFRERLDDAVRVRLVSDVPFGAFLSGGIDSSAVVALMTRHMPRPVKTFAAGFEEDRYSELAFARLTAERFRTEHAELVVTRDQVFDELPALVGFRDAPVSEPSDVVVHLLAREARRTVKMVLTGEGGDEVLGGYPKHTFERYVGAYHVLPELLRRRLIEPLVHALPYGLRRVKTAVATLGLERPEDRLPRWFGALSRREWRDLVAPALAAEASPAGAGDAFETDPGNSALRRVLYFDQLSWLPDNLLERGDRMTMAASIEARVPFLDTALVAFVSSLPDGYRVRGRRTKWILRQAVAGLVPDPIRRRAKVGFRVPVNEWLRLGKGHHLSEYLTESGSMTREYYRLPALRRVLDEHVRGRQNHEKLLWTLLNLELWHRVCLRQPPAGAPAHGLESMSRAV